MPMINGPFGQKVRCVSSVFSLAETRKACRTDTGLVL
jgi:hypothetical protein